MFTFLGPDPVEQQIDELLRRIVAGEQPSAIETRQVDCKEERGRRGPGGVVLAGRTENDEAARHLAKEMACFANTPGGGAVVVGIADNGDRIGTRLDPEWLRHRIYELSNRQLTVDIRPVDLNAIRLLVLKTNQAIEPVRTDGRIFWRVGDHCVEIDATTWHSEHMQRSGIDWSSLPSGHLLTDASAVAIEIARRFLAEAAGAGDPTARTLLDATDADLVRRLNLVTGDGVLTNAGSLLLVGTPGDGIDYIRRDVPGGDSINRIRSNRPLIEQIYEVDQAISNANRIIHSGEGLAKGQSRAIPPRAAREAVVNGAAHRDWLSHEPTTVEHTGDMLTVTSPGGLPGSVRPDNIITHPSAPRYRSLAEALAAMRLAEREGIGVDRMVGDMLAVGLRAPGIAELPGPSVRVSLIGGDPDAEIVGFLGRLAPRSSAADLDIVILIDHLAHHGFVDVSTAARVLQRPADESAAAIDRAADTTIGGNPTIAEVAGVPDGHPPAYRLSGAAKRTLPRRLAALTSPSGRTRMILEWATARGRVSSTEVADLAGLSSVRSGQILTELSDDGLLAPGKAKKMGRGFFYVPVHPAD